MISVPVVDINGKEVGKYDFDPAELASSISMQLLHDVVVMYEANRRQGTAKTKSRAEVDGTTNKMYRQKGTGRARAGSVRSPIRKGGGHTFAKRPKDWSYRLPKKAVKMATRMALLSKFQDDQVTVLDDLEVSEPKTRIVADLLKTLKLDRDTCLLTIEHYDVNIYKSGRNIEKLKVSPASDLNAYDLLCQRRLLVTRGAMDKIRGVGKEQS